MRVCRIASVAGWRDSTLSMDGNASAVGATKLNNIKEET